jgi:TldD protein
MIERDLKAYSGFFTAYTELRIQENRHIRIALVKGNLVGNARSSNSGVSARVYKKGSWGFASSPELFAESVESVVDSATRNAVFLDSRIKRAAQSLPSRPTTSENDFSTKKPRLSQTDLVGFVRTIDEHIEKSYPGLTSRTVILSCQDMEKSVLTSDGSSFYSMVPRTNIIIILTAEKDGQPVELHDVYGSRGQFEDVFGAPSELGAPSGLFERIEQQHEHLMNKREGIFADAGVKECVIGPELAGILAHEALGHTTEADIVKGGSVAPEYLNREAASSLITLVDFAHEALGETCPVPVYVDDEGTRAEDAVIIDKGVLKSYMHNKQSAMEFQMPVTGNARAYQFSDEPLIRMRNTAIVPGESRMDEMIGSVDDGYYLVRPSNGQADSTGEFMFGVPLGYEIKKGKLKRALKNTTISGVAFDVLRSVTMVSDDMYWSSGGMCGKKQLIPVGLGGPAIKCRVNVGGR